MTRAGDPRWGGFRARKARRDCDPSIARRRRASLARGFVFGLEVALAVVAALRASRRAVAVGLALVADPGFVAAAPLHQHTAALAVGDQRVFAGSLERLFTARRVAAGGFILHRLRNLRARKRSDLVAELFAQHAGLDLLDLTFRQFAQLKRPVGDPDQPVHL